MRNPLTFWMDKWASLQIVVKSFKITSKIKKYIVVEKGAKRLIKKHRNFARLEVDAMFEKVEVIMVDSYKFYYV